jgi:Dolichyl-phosphate-mannose-protein mannosyltransferase
MRNILQRLRDHRVWPWLVIAAASGLLAWRLDRKNLWLDEAVSWDMAISPTTRLLALTAADIHPPLYYLVLKGWLRIVGDSPVGLRSLSVVSGVVALGLMYRLARSVLPFGIACAALCWYALSPHTIAYGQEARMYAPSAAAVLGMCLAYRRWVDSGCERASALVTYVACLTVALYLHYFTGLVLVAIWLHALTLAIGRYGTITGRAVRARWKTWLLAHCAVAILYAPWIHTAVTQITRGQYWRMPVTLGQIPAHASDLARMLMFGTDLVLPIPAVSCVVVFTLLAAGLALVVIRAGKRQPDERAAFVALVALVPLALGLALLPLAGELELSRYLAYAAPLVIVAAAYGLRSSGLRPAWVMSALVVAGLMPLPSLAAYYESPVRDYDAGPIVSYLSAAAHHGPAEEQDLILVAPGYVTYVLSYLSRRNLAYERIDTEAEFPQAVLRGRSESRTTWLIVDYGWPEFDELSHDARFIEHTVSLNRPGRIKLLRVRPSPPTMGHLNRSPVAHDSPH